MSVRFIATADCGTALAVKKDSAEGRALSELVGFRATSKTAFNIHPAEHDALLALLRHVEARGGYVQIRLDSHHSVTLLASGKLIAGPMNSTRATHANIDAWLASLNA